MFRSVATAALVFIALASQAQGPGSGGPGGPGSGGPTPNPTTGVPIDGGASILLASGAVYAVRRLRQGRRK